jgi:hypothetical protein
MLQEHRVAILWGQEILTNDDEDRWQLDQPGKKNWIVQQWGQSWGKFSILQWKWVCTCASQKRNVIQCQICFIELTNLAWIVHNYNHYYFWVEMRAPNILLREADLVQL